MKDVMTLWIVLLLCTVIKLKLTYVQPPITDNAKNSHLMSFVL